MNFISGNDLRMRYGTALPLKEQINYLHDAFAHCKTLTDKEELSAYFGNLAPQMRKLLTKPIAEQTEKDYHFARWVLLLADRKNFDQHIRFVQELQTATQYKANSVLHIEIYPQKKYHFARTESCLKLSEALIWMNERNKSILLEGIAKQKPALTRLAITNALNQETVLRILQYFHFSGNAKNQPRPQGKFYNLEQIFANVNRTYFNGQIPQPILRWSVRENLTRMGSYHLLTDVLTINSALDTQNTPMFVLEYIMYHELLHKILGVKYENGRMNVHDAHFHSCENVFARATDAEAYLKALSAKLRQSAKMKN